jgi:osmotically inducible protein OsmC
MPVRHATAKWDGSLTEGSGTMRFADYEGPFSFSSRFEEGAGTNPEELIGAAFAGCFSMALSADLGDAGHNAESVSTEATVEVHPQPAGGFAITKIHLKTNATVPGIDAAAFQKIADGTKQNCPVAKALAAVPVSLEAKLN